MCPLNVSPLFCVTHGLLRRNYVTAVKGYRIQSMRLPHVSRLNKCLQTQQPNRGLGWLFGPELPKHHPGYKRQNRNFLISCGAIIMTSGALGYLAVREEVFPEFVQKFNNERFQEMERERVIKEQQDEREALELEMEKARVRLKGGQFKVPEIAAPWATDFLKGCDVKPPTQEPTK